ncbi:Trafficking protein particle complex subunit 2 [Glycine soja]|nr:Trafficking protein particle complex subunit 2 [Glycine soja]
MIASTSTSTNVVPHPLRFLSKPTSHSTTRFLSLTLHSRGIAVALSSSSRTTPLKPTCHFNSKDGSFELHEDEDERDVHCEVQVISWRERKVNAQITVDADTESVWNALTDYEHLADFIPNLVWSGRIPCPYPGRIWLEQRGFQRAMYWHIEARVVLDLREVINSAWDRELHFSMVDGDFKKFDGKWSVKSGTRSSTAILSYEVDVIPRFNFPAIFLERIIRSDLPVNLRALAYRAERNFVGYQKLPVSENHLRKTYAAINGSSVKKINGASSESFKKINGALCGSDKLPPAENKKEIATSVSGSMLTSSSEVRSNWGVFGKVCRLDRPRMVDEVHLRRFDGLLENGGVHRCVVASITVKAPVREVWNILTAYETLPEIVPNLAISKVVSRDNSKVRILQEGCKGLLYMVLHARVVLDLCEYLEQEISFEQVEGDFDSFRGKWIFEQLGNHHTLLKYSVESKMRKDTFLSEAIMEEVIYEDLPSNLSAIRDYIENMNASKSSEVCEQNTNSGQQIVSSGSQKDDNSGSTEEVPHCDVRCSSQQRSKVPGLQRNIKVLESELLKFIAEHGQEGFMPMRKQLRLHGRVDIEKAITRMGGFRKIATILNLSLAYKHRKPKGYWDNLENLQEEISRFQRSWGIDPSFMPSRKSFERAGRYDIARALEKWGGLHEVSRLLSLKVRQRSRQDNLAKDKRSDHTDSEMKTPLVRSIHRFVQLKSCNPSFKLAISSSGILKILIMATTACFIIVSRNDIPIYEAEVGVAAKREDAAQLHQFILHAALDIVQDLAWTTSAMYLKSVDRFNELVVSVYVTAVHTRLMLLHDSRNDDGIKSFFQEVHELYIKTLLNPLYLPGSRITSSHFDTKVRALARKYL